jgi:type I restriction enzyme, S subunit
MVENVKDVAQPLPEDSATYIGLEHLDPGSLEVTRWGTDIDLKGQKLRMRTGDVLFARRNAYLRRVAVAPFDGLFSAHGSVFRARPDVVLPEFLPFFMQSGAFFERALSISVGSLSPTINWSTLKDEEFDLPSIDEQREIAELMWGVEAARRALGELLSRLRRLKVGLFTERTRSIAELKSVGELVEAGILRPPQDGNHGEKHPKARDFSASGIPFLTAGDLSDSRLDLNECKFIPEPLAKSLRVGFAQEGDVLLTHKGTVGLAAIVPTAPFPFLMLSPQVTYYRIEDERRLERNYLLSFFKSPACQEQLARLGKQSTRAYVSIKTQYKLRVPMMDVEGQRELINELAAVDRSIAMREDQLMATRELARGLLNHAVTGSL